ncbi:hypothetical protein FRC17_006367, partial [Serendipita sp. 399]
NDNLGKGGAGNDRIKISVQDGSGTNNANFATPADGTSGQMRMYIWTFNTPNRDGDLSNDVIAHEQTHGTTNRMTGGGTGRCLQTTESGGMGEGWSDAFAEWLEHKDASVPDFVLGAWVYNNPKGIRTYPYSTSSSTNPLKYSSIKTLNEVHDIGEVWANMLHNVYAELVGQFGWAADAFKNADSDKGNVVFLRLFYDALLLQPCNPTLPQARSAWIQADTNRYVPLNFCPSTSRYRDASPVLTIRSKVAWDLTPPTTPMTSRSQLRALVVRLRPRRLPLAPPPRRPAPPLRPLPARPPLRLLVPRAPLPVAPRPRPPTTAPGGGPTAPGRK